MVPLLTNKHKDRVFDFDQSDAGDGFIIINVSLVMYDQLCMLGKQHEIVAIPYLVCRIL